jgi:DNA-binding XRE family transcriptional regulator
MAFIPYPTLGDPVDSPPFTAKRPDNPVHDRTEAAAAGQRLALARQLRELRHAIGLSQVELAELSGVPQSEISRIERGAANPTMATLARLSVALGAEMRMEFPGS